MKSLHKFYYCGLVLLLAIGCELTDDDYSDIVFTIHLEQQIITAQNLYDSAVEGTNLGEYEVGSKAELQSSIDSAQAVLDKANPSQEEVDEAYRNLENAIDTFMAREITEEDGPDTGDLENRIVTAQNLHDNATEGTDPGEYEAGSKTELQRSIDSAQFTLDKASLSQEEVDEACINLEIAVDTFMTREIRYDYDVVLINPSFEVDGLEADSVPEFANITGWESTPLRYDWAKSSSILEEVGEATDGSYVASIASYGFGIYQTFEAALQGGATYSLTGNFRIKESPADWIPEFYNTYIVTKFIVINGNEPAYNSFGGFDNITILSENITNLSDAQSTDWESITHEFTVDINDENVDRQFALSIFIYEEGVDLNDPDNTEVWAESFVYADNLSLTKSEE
ncbi:MAG: FIVAR domain-containing protein [Bacteroidota bacterium]